MLQLVLISLILLVCVLLVLVVLAQNSKGGGLTAGMSGASQIMGAKRTTDWIEKATWVLAISLFVLCISAQITQPDRTAANQEEEIPLTPKGVNPGAASQMAPGASTPPSDDQAEPLPPAQDQPAAPADNGQQATPQADDPLFDTEQE